MSFYDIEEVGLHLSGSTWLMTTPDDTSPVLSIYFTYSRTSDAPLGEGIGRGAIVLQAVHAHEF